MTARFAIPADWVKLELAPFLMRRELEPSDEEIGWEAEWSHAFATTPRYGHLWIDWDAATVSASVPCDHDHCDDDDSDHCVLAMAHPIHFHAVALRSLGRDTASEFTGLVDSFWRNLVHRFNGLVAENVLEIHARGGPQPASSHGFRWVAPDVWASSLVDWASGTCKTPDGQIYFSIQVSRAAAKVPPTACDAARSEAVRTKAVRSMKPLETPVSAKGAAMTRREAAKFIGMSMSWLEKRRDTPNNPPFHKIGNRTIYYVAEIEAWRETDAARILLAIDER